jgi:hypothetical protein
MLLSELVDGGRGLVSVLGVALGDSGSTMSVYRYYYLVMGQVIKEKESGRFGLL